LTHRNLASSGVTSKWVESRLSINSGESRVEGVFSVAETAAVTVPSGGILQEGCATGGNNGSVAEDAGIIAIRVLSSSLG
jgi:hypothetical protein